jgi:mannose-1-phosphate guanylyltransferase
MDKNYYGVIMAGGVGSRFWPVSTTSNPKQFHDMLGSGESLLQRTFKRLSRFIPSDNILILTNEQYGDLVLRQLPGIRPDQVIGEPAMRNTAPCILYAALKIEKKNPDALMLVAPSDHWIEDEEGFASDVSRCFEYCKNADALCTLGITPNFPNTGYGYIEYEKDEVGKGGLKKVVQFREKPSYEQARSFLDQGNFLWNAGIFIWSTRSIIRAFKKHQPKQFRLFEEGIKCFNTPNEKGFIESRYPQADNISIDYAILEKSRNIFVLPASFDWNDLGTWGSLYDKLEKDEDRNAVVQCESVMLKARGNLVRSQPGKLVVLEGLSDFIVVDRNDVLLIVPRAREQEIKLIVAEVKNKHGDHYL